MTGESVVDNDARTNKTAGSSIIGTLSATTYVARNLGFAAVPPASVAVTASPMTLTSPDFPTTLFVNGALTALTVDGVSIDPVTKALPLELADTVVLTYSSAPTLSRRGR